MSRTREIISTELDNAEKQLGACVELVTLYPAREVIAKNAAVQRVKWAAEVQRLANELGDAEFSEEGIL